MGISTMVELVMKLTRAFLQHTRRSARHFRANAISRQEHNLLFQLHSGSPLWTGRADQATEEAPVATGTALAADHFVSNGHYIARANLFGLIGERCHAAVTFRQFRIAGANSRGLRASAASAWRPECLPRTKERDGTPTASGEMIS